MALVAPRDRDHVEFGRNPARNHLGTARALLFAAHPEVYLEAVPSDMKNAVQNVEDLLIGPKWTQVPDWPEMRSTLIN